MSGTLADYWSEETRSRLAEFRAEGSVLAATGGCFDVFHAGHIATIAFSRRQGQRLVVLLNDDASIRRLKGPSRPINRLEHREAVLRALRDVDLVATFDGHLPPVLADLRPDVWIKGGDYSANTLQESEQLVEQGCRVEIAPMIDGLSTTKILSLETTLAETTGKR